MRFSHPSFHRHFNHYLASDAQRFGGLGLWLVFRCLPTLLAVCLAMLLLTITPARADVEAANSLSPSAVETGEMLLQDATGGSYVRAPMMRSKVHIDISGMIATVSVEQTFHNDTDNFVEGVYAFPLPDSAAVRRLEMDIGDRRIIGEIKEKHQAKRIYRSAKAAGKKASLVEQQRPNLFTNRVANIGPGESIVVRMEYVETVAITGETFSLRFPTTITARYMPGTPLNLREADQRDISQETAALDLNPYLGWAHNTTQVHDAQAISPLQLRSLGNEQTPKHPVTITATLDMGMPLASVESPYHDIALQRRAGVYRISLRNVQSEMDRDFVLNWQPVRGSTPQAAFFTEKVGGEHYGLLMVLPPAAALAPAAKPSAAIKRDMTFVIDTSGSMGGVSIEQARASVSRALEELRETDFFNVIAFSSSYRKLFPVSAQATPSNVSKAQRFVSRLDASGGTEMLPALLAALAPGDDVEAGRLEQVIFVTDGAVGNESALFEEIAKRLGNYRLFTVGIGSAPNSWFMRKAAEFGRGTHTHIGNIGEVEQKMAALFAQLARPAAVDLDVTWPGAVDMWPARLPDIYMGEPLVVAVKFGDQAPTGEVAVSAVIGRHTWRQSLRLNNGADPQNSPEHSGVASVWARKKIGGLLDEITLGVNADEIRQKVLPIALTHQLLSPYTSFVAVEQVVTRPPEDSLLSKAVANVRPRGQATQAFALPQTATTGPAKVWFGFLSLFIALIIRLLSQGEVDHVS
ncbi:MAG: marine proteobacterial sortase target protein [Halioglobus sp.]